MSKCYSAESLYCLRNGIPINTVISVFEWPHKEGDGDFRFLCPCWLEFDTAINPATNLGRCFHCEKNLDSVDFVIRVQTCDFLEAVDYLSPFLSSAPLPGVSWSWSHSVAIVQWFCRQTGCAIGKCLGSTACGSGA